jgi:[ribosomal protein S18]-alanine N-acetyltransferase
MMDKMSNNKFTVRDYRKGDFDGIKRLWDLTDMGNPIRGDDEATIEESIRIGGILLIMEETASGNVAGTSWMTYDGRRIHLHHFGILPEFQGKGLSKLLMDESLRFVRKKSCQAKLEVHRSNIKAVNLYKKAGFSCLGDYDVYIIRDISAIK